jgi:hypothetical protein
MKWHHPRHRRTAPSYRAAAATLAIACALGASVLAFKPTAEFGHVGIVTAALTPITRTS